MSKFGRSFKYAVQGLMAIWREELSFRIQSVAAVILLVLTISFNFDYMESAIIAIAVTIVLLAEATNTVIERIMDKIEPNIDPVVGKIKDMMAGVVLIGSMGAAIVGLTVLIHHFLH
jgi:diacylglycerol kinase